MKKKIITGLLACTMGMAALTGCGQKEATTGEEAVDAAEGEEAGESVTLHVFAAASMTETLEKIQTMYQKTAPDVTLVFNFDSSGTLKTQIQEGAECDLFISAAQKQMNQLDITADPEVNEEGLDLVLEGVGSIFWKIKWCWQ